MDTIKLVIYDWDEAKRADNLAKHGIDFAVVEGFEWDSALMAADGRRDYGELRYSAFGLIEEHLFNLVFTPRAAKFVFSACAARIVERCATMSTKRKIKIPNAAEDAAINVGITADPDNPEWRPADFARAEPAANVLPRLFGKEDAAEMLKPKRGRPISASPKAHVNIRLDADVVEQFRATGRGWQTRLNAALKEWLKAHSRA